MLAAQLVGQAVPGTIVESVRHSLDYQLFVARAMPSKPFVLAVVIAISTCATALAQPGFTPAPSFAGPNPAVVRVVVPESDGASYGSGTLVAVNESSGLIVTNWHVVRDAAGTIVVYFPDGFHSGAYLLHTDRDWDLAALAIRRPNVQPVSLATQAPQPGEQLTIAGYGSGSYRAISGRVTQYVSPGDNQPFEMVELSAPARNGDSGGPILNSRGELAGVLFGSAHGRTAGSYCGRVRGFLASVDGSFQRISAQAMLAQQQPRNSLPTALAAVSPQMAQSGNASVVVDSQRQNTFALAADGSTAAMLPEASESGPSQRWPRDVQQQATPRHSTLPKSDPAAAQNTVSVHVGDAEQTALIPASAVATRPAGTIAQHRPDQDGPGSYRNHRHPLPRPAAAGIGGGVIYRGPTAPTGADAGPTRTE